MVKEGLINLDFADVRVVMQSMGTALMGTGEAEGEQRALRAAEMAISNPLLDEVSMRDAKGLLISITGSFDMTLYEVEEAASRVRREVDPEANPDINIIVGATFDHSIEGRIRVSVVATGINAGQAAARDEGGERRPRTAALMERATQQERQAPQPGPDREAAARRQRQSAGDLAGLRQCHHRAALAEISCEHAAPPAAAHRKRPRRNSSRNRRLSRSARRAVR